MDESMQRFECSQLLYTHCIVKIVCTTHRTIVLFSLSQKYFQKKNL